jgi:hypothetical protein
MKSKNVTVVKAVCSLALAWSLILGTADSFLSQGKTPASKAGALQRHKVHGKSLEGNLHGESGGMVAESAKPAGLFRPPGKGRQASAADRREMVCKHAAGDGRSIHTQSQEVPGARG